MMQWAGPAMDTLWHNGLAAIPLVLVAAAASRLLPCRPATRHLIWVTVLIWLVGSSLLPQSPVAQLASQSTDSNSLSVVLEAQQTAAEQPTPSTIKKPRTLTSRLAKSDVAASNAAVPPESAAKGAANALRSRTDSTPPPRYAARAETSAPDKLARAQEAAGPRSLAGRPAAPTVLNLNKPPSSTRSIFMPSTTSPQVAAWKSTAHSQPNAVAGEASQTPISSKPKFHAPEKVISEKPALTSRPSKETTPLSPPIMKEVGKAAAWKQWAAALVGVRNAVSELPAIPQSVWLGGTGLLFILAGARIAHFHRRLRRARPASSEVLALVESACKTLGLRCVPEILMVDGRLSPMVWCGVTPKLILPMQLWEQLDDLGRKAVVFHELAHIRRLDHRTAWIESAIGMLYWWHPLVWWVRGRLHAEAENCCDAWVMTLLPKRRAYATALLKTREYLSGGDALPAMGIGITPGRARLFARRLTMVMTESVRPKLSASGITLVMLVAICGWIAAPARSCPEEDAAKAAREAAPSPKAITSFEKYMADRGKAGLLVAQPLPAPFAVAAPVMGVPAQPAIPAIPALAGIVQVSDRDGKKARRVAELQAELARLERKIESLTEALEEQEEADNDDEDDAHEHAHDHADDDDGDDDDDTPRAPRAPRPPRPPHAPRAAQPGIPAVPPMPPMPPMPPHPGAHGHGPAFAPGATPKPGQSWADVTGEKTGWRTYKLSKGKGEDFFKFMSRSDVPIWVRSNPDGIDIQATPRQHEVFDAFFRLVDPSEDRGPAQSLFFGGPGPMLAFAHSHGAGFGEGCGKCMEAAQMRALAAEVRAGARAQAVELRAKARGDGERIKAQARDEAEKARARMRRHARDARSEARDQHEAIEQLERQAQALAEVAQNYQEQAERINERAQSVNEKVEKDSEAAAAADAYRVHVESLERSAEELNRQAEDLQRQAETIEQRAREVEENAREMEEHADELDQRADAVREAVDTLESGVEPTPELVESVLALVNGIERMIPDTKEIIEDAMSAVSGELESAGEVDPSLEEPDEDAPETEAPQVPEAPVVIESEPKDGM